MKFNLFHDSRIGGRSNNEDRLGHQATSDAAVLVVADGLGGHGHGEVAAEAAVRSVLASFQRKATPRLENLQIFLADAMANAHSAILAQTDLRKLDDQPRSTCVACVVQDDIACWAHTGDSRFYLLRNGQVLTRTRDHSRIQALIDEGRITPEQARTHPYRNALTSCMGGEPAPRFEFSAPQALKHGDVLLLCSDGVWGPLADDAPLAALSTRNAVQTAPALLDRIEASAGANRDNLSLLLMVWENEARTAVPQPTWTPDDFSKTINTTRDRLHAKETK